MNFLNFCVLQMELKWESVEVNLKSIEQHLLTLPKDTHVLLLPEMFNTGFSMNVANCAEQMDGYTINWMRQIAAQHQIVVAGTVMIKEREGYFNRLIWMQPNGIHYEYDKKHLFGKAKEDDFFTAGDKRVVVQVNGFKILLQICYDLRFPVWSRQQKDPFDAIVYLANWPEVRIDAWNTLLKARAIENQVYVLGCNCVGQDLNTMAYNGSSCVFAPDGQVVWEAALGQAEVGKVRLLKVKIEQTRKRLPFLKDRDDFILI